MSALPASSLRAAALFALLALPGCVPLIAGTVGTTAVVAAQDRSVGDAVDDLGIRAEINRKWLDHSVELANSLQLQVVEGRVTVAGRVATPQLRVDAIRLVWQVDGVREVNNEIQVADAEGFSGWWRDTRISGELRTALTFDNQVSSVNYSIDTVGGVIYIMGIAQDQAELQRVVNHARNISGVQRVVTHTRFQKPLR